MAVLTSRFLSRPSFEDEIFEGLDLAGHRLERKEIEGCTFVSCSLQGAVFDRCRLVSCEFRSSDLSLLEPGDSSFREVRFIDSKVMGVDWTRAGVGLGFDVGFERSILDDGSFMGLDLEGLRMIGCRARGVNFVGSRLTGADFTATDLSESRFAEADLRGADFSGALNVVFDPRVCRLKDTKLSLEAALGVLGVLGVRVPDLG